MIENKFTYDTLCLSGGGISGISFIGSLKYLSDNNYIDLTLITNYVGTSVGAIIAYLLGLKYNIQELYDFILAFNIKTLESNITISNLLEKNGIDDGSKYILVFKSFLKNKYQLDDITFKELFDLTGNKLLIIGTNYTRGKEEIFSYETSPDMSVITAVRISISIPIIFIPVLYKSEYYVDGGLVNNFPINHCNLDTTLGLHVNINKEVNEISNILSIVKTSIDILLSSQSTISHKNIIYITNILETIVDYNITFEQKIKLINHGETCAMNFINNLSMDVTKTLDPNL